MHFADVLRALRELAGVTELGGHALMVEYSSPIERHPLEVSTNSFPVPEVPFSERSLQRVLFSKNIPVDGPCAAQTPLPGQGTPHGPALAKTNG